MSNVKEVTVGAKKSWSFQTYEVSLVIEIMACEDEIEVIRKAQAQCRKLCQEQIDIDKGKLVK